MAKMAFEWCDGDQIAGPARFRMVLWSDDDVDDNIKGACRFGYWPNSEEKTQLDVAGMKLAITGSAALGLRYRVTSRVPAQTLGPLESNGPIRSRAEAPSLEALSRARHISLSREFLVAGDTPLHLTPGLIPLGQVIATGSAHYGITGVLRNTVKPQSGLLGLPEQRLEVGSPVFGVPAADEGGDGMIWCAPRASDNGQHQIVCLTPEWDGYIWYNIADEVVTPFSIAKSLIFGSGSYLASSAPDVLLSRTSLPSMTLSWRLTSISMDRTGVPAPVFHVDEILDKGKGPLVIRKFEFECPPKGKHLKMLGVELVLKSGTAPGSLEVEPSSN